MDGFSSIDSRPQPEPGLSGCDLDTMEEALHRATTHLRVTLESIGDAVITTDVDGFVDALNPVAEDLTGWKQAEARGLPLCEVFQVMEAACRLPQETFLSDTAGRDISRTGVNHTLLLCRDGREFAIQETLSPILDREGRVTGSVLVFHDLSHTHELAQQLSYQASHDLLTGLPNRREFERRLDMALRSACAEGVNHAICYLDLDQF